MRSCPSFLVVFVLLTLLLGFMLLLPGDGLFMGPVPAYVGSALIEIAEGIPPPINDKGILGINPGTGFGCAHIAAVTAVDSQDVHALLVETALRKGFFGQPIPFLHLHLSDCELAGKLEKACVIPGIQLRPFFQGPSDETCQEAVYVTAPGKEQQKEHTQGKVDKSP
jgi:hypothetical protein